MIGITILLGVSALLFASAVLRGWVLSWLWLWFIVPLGAPDIGVAWAVGISVLMSMLAQSPKVDSDKGEDAGEKFAKAIALMLVSPLIALLVGWIAHSVMVS